MSTTEQPRLDQNDEPQLETVAPVVDAPVTEDTEARIEPWVFASTSANRKEPMRPRNKALIALGAVATAATLVTLLAVLPSGGSGNGKAGASTPKPTETSQSDQPTSNPNNGGEISNEVIAQTTSVEAMDAMTGPEGLKTFANLSYADHLAYAFAKNPQMGITNPTEDYGFTTPSGMPAYFWDSIDGTALSDGNTTEGAKIAAAENYYPVDASGEIDASYQAQIDSIEQTGGNGVRNSVTHVFVDSGAPQVGVDKSGKKINYINVTYYLADSTTAKREGGDITVQAIRQDVKLLSGKVITFYPFGLTAQGHAAPDGGTY